MQMQSRQLHQSSIKQKGENPNIYREKEILRIARSGHAKQKQQTTSLQEGVVSGLTKKNR